MPIFLYDDAIKSIGFQGISDPHNLPMIPEARKASRKGEPVMNTDTTFARFKKIDAHTHIGAFGSPFNIHFDTERLLQQMEAYNIEKTILVASGPHTNEDTAAAFRAEPQKIIPLMWINCAEGKEAVSYTHLDVYKRQPWPSLLFILQTSLQAGWRCDRQSPGNWRSVSYTHLLMVKDPSSRYNRDLLFILSGKLPHHSDDTADLLLILLSFIRF